MRKINFIAEIGSNHNQSIERTEKLIKEASELGFWGVKFQLFDESMYNGMESKESITKTKLPIEFLPKIKKLCKKYKLKLGITPFYNDAIIIAKKYADYIKISSFDFERFDFIKYCIMTNKQAMISFGLCNNNEIDQLKYFILNLSIRKDTVYMHCVSGYPVDESDAATDRINYIKKYIRHGHAGYSDHTGSVTAILAAIVDGAEYIEMHYDLEDKNGNETKHGHCWTRFEASKTIRIANELHRISTSQFLIDEKMYNLKANENGVRNA